MGKGVLIYCGYPTKVYATWLGWESYFQKGPQHAIPLPLLQHLLQSKPILHAGCSTKLSLCTQLWKCQLELGCTKAEYQTWAAGLTIQCANHYNTKFLKLGVEKYVMTKKKIISEWDENRLWLCWGCREYIHQNWWMSKKAINLYIMKFFMIFFSQFICGLSLKIAWTF